MWAITIRLVEKSVAVAEALPGVRLLPGAFESSYTKPTTAYSTRKVVPRNAHPADVYRLRLEHPHWPLIWMLLLSQLAAGLSLSLAAAWLLREASHVAAPLAVGACAALQAGLVLSVFHLGKPLKAWRFFLGLRTSWMSREILVFSMYAGASVSAAGASVLHFDGLAWPLAFASAASAVAGIFCSAMIYVDTHRPFWNARIVFPKFFGTTAVLGLSASAAILHGLSLPGEMAQWASAAALAGALVFNAWDGLVLLRAVKNRNSAAHRSALTIWNLLRAQLGFRAAALGMSFIGGLGAMLLPAPLSSPFAVAFLILTFLTAIVERYCFFTASDAPRMPGGIAA